MGPIGIANCSGYYGDRVSAFAEVAATPGVDVITGDYLAEVTMFVLAKGRTRDPDAGYAASFPIQLASALDTIVENRIKVVVNAGGLNPAGLAERLRKLFIERNVDLTVAIVDGDDILGDVDQLEASGQHLPHLQTGQPLAEWPHEPLTANAYLGAWGIASALAKGADIVVTGRVTDASLVVGAAAWWHGWQRDDFDALAGAVVAGHLIECGTQVTGGNYSGFASLGSIGDPSFPLARIAEDGSSEISLCGDGGRVTTGTVTAQLLYEVETPAYLNPDVVAHFDTIALEEVERDVVRVSNTQGSAPPLTTKVAITARGGFRNHFTTILTGLDVEAKLAWLQSAIEDRLSALPGIERVDYEVIGTPDLTGATQGAASTIVRITATGDEKSVGRPFGAAIISLALANIPGFYGLSLPGSAQSFGTYWPAVLDLAVVPHRVTHADGTVELIEPTGGEEVRSPQPTPPTVERDPDGATTSIELGKLVDARSGDKGGDANVGVWVRDRAHWEWLRDSLTAETVKRLLPDLAELEIDRYEFENLGAVNFVVRGLLGEGATANTRVDNQAKALGEYLRSRTIEVPSRLLA